MTLDFCVWRFPRGLICSLSGQPQRGCPLGRHCLHIKMPRQHFAVLFSKYKGICKTYQIPRVLEWVAIAFSQIIVTNIQIL